MSILRASGVPSAIRPGKNVVLGDTARQPQFTNHVRAQFWLDGVGWVPVEVSGAQGLDNSRDPEFFGFDSGEFLTLHFGSDMPVQTGKFNGLRIVRSFQDPSYFVLCGPGKWQVSREEQWQGVPLPLNAPAPPRP